TRRRGGRAVRGPLALRDDARVRRRVAAGEDRHARLRRRRRGEQVRAARRGGRPARRRPPAGPQPRSVRRRVGGHARLRDERGVPALYQHLRGQLAERGLSVRPGTLPTVTTKVSTGLATMVPPGRVTYLADVAQTVRDYHGQTSELAELARRRQTLTSAAD